MNWICSQIGAREHYAIPRTLHTQGKLARLYTDFWANPTWRAIGRLTGQAGMATRYHRELRNAPVSAFNLLAIAESRRAFSNPYEGFLKIGASFGRRFTTHSTRRFKETRVIAKEHKTLVRNGISQFKGLARGGKTVVCQMDPSRFEVELVKVEEDCWYGCAKLPTQIPDARDAGPNGLIRCKKSSLETECLALI